jgi:hypothetical protein
MLKRLVTLALAPLFVVALLGCASTQEVAEEPTPLAGACVTEGGGPGIEIVRLFQTAEGRMLDLRYRVTDPEKAAMVFDRRNKAYLIDQATGLRLTVPTTAKVGPLRQTNFQPDPNRVYFILFSNPGVVKPGSLVTLEVGDYRVENIVVE